MTKSDTFGRFRTVSDIIGQFRTLSDWTFLVKKGYKKGIIVRSCANYKISRLYFNLNQNFNKKGTPA